MTTLLVEDIGLLVHGDRAIAPVRDTTLLIEDGVIAEIGATAVAPDQVLSAGGLTVMPGLIDGHVHPTFGEWTPAQDAVGWIHNYLHGGTTSMVSAGELHIPGLAFDALTPELVLSIAITSKHTTGRMRPSGVKVNAGTVLLVPGMTEEHFDRAHREGIDQLKFIFYDWNRLGDGEAQRYVQWAHDRGMTVKMHSGGVSRSGSSRVAGADVVLAVAAGRHRAHLRRPDPGARRRDRAIIAGLPDGNVEVCSSMNYRATKVVADELMPARQAGPAHARHRHTRRDGGDSARDAAQHLLSGVGVRRGARCRPWPQRPAIPLVGTALRTGVLGRRHARRPPGARSDLGLHAP